MSVEIETLHNETIYPYGDYLDLSERGINDVRKISGLKNL